MTGYEFLFLVVGVAIGGAAGYFHFRKQLETARQKYMDCRKSYMDCKDRKIKTDFFKEDHRISRKLIRRYINYKVEWSNFQDNKLGKQNAMQFVRRQLKSRKVRNGFVHMIPLDCIDYICAPAIKRAKEIDDKLSDKKEIES